jgi:uncharacterized YccA/Bax inhibitor family protein
MRTANPALQERTFHESAMSSDRAGVMTINGTVAKTGILTALLLAAAGLSWAVIFPNGVGSRTIQFNYAILFLAGGGIGALILSIVLFFSQRLAPALAPVYAVCEGLFLGALSGLVGMQYQGIVLNAALLTAGVLGVMLLLYSTGIIRATEKFKTGVLAATGAVCVVYLASFILRLCGVPIPYIHSAGPIGIGFSAVVIAIAALNLVLDFDMIEEGARYGAPKYMEWYGAYGLIVTLVWLYIEILRMLMKISDYMGGE